MDENVFEHLIAAYKMMTVAHREPRHELVTLFDCILVWLHSARATALPPDSKWHFLAALNVVAQLIRQENEGDAESLFLQLDEALGF
jgi:hypothetical protein